MCPQPVGSTGYVGARPSPSARLQRTIRRIWERFIWLDPLVIPRQDIELLLALLVKSVTPLVCQGSICQRTMRMPCMIPVVNSLFHASRSMGDLFPLDEMELLFLGALLPFHPQEEPWLRQVLVVLISHSCFTMF